MPWQITYHRAVEQDLADIGAVGARRVMNAIDAKLTQHPEQFGAPLSGDLADFRKLRVGDYRVVYRVVGHTVTVFVLAVGPRRDAEIYHTATRRAR